MKTRLVICTPDAEWQKVRQHEISTALALHAGALESLKCVAIVVGSDGLPNWPATEYLLECAVTSQSITGDTVRTYGESLTAWIRHLDERGLPLAAATERQLKLYRNALTNSPPKLSPFTVNARILTVLRFYDWGEQTGKLRSPLGRWRTTERAAAAGFMGRSPTLRLLVPRQPIRLPRTLTPQQLTNLLAASKLPYRLMFRWAACTGLRRVELCSLKSSDIQSPTVLPSGLNQIEIQRKGGRYIRVYIPQRLVDETRWYALTDRPSSQAFSDSDHLFLTKRGKPVDKRRLSNEFRKAATSIGSPATLHHLRHTYAVTLFGHLQRSADDGAHINPLKTLQILLGHASISSTEIYLRALEIDSPTVNAALAFLYGEAT